MGETANTSRMAEILSKEVFSEFLWKKSGPYNANWPCVTESHNRKAGTHPSDVVFYYDEPYHTYRTYVTCDLKSYAQGSISASGVRAAVYSLAQSISCAEQSEEWQELYVHKDVSVRVSGLLFVYNHDGNYDRDFRSLLKDIRPDSLKLPPSTKLVVMGPEDVLWLCNVSNDIVRTRGKEELPERKYCHFYHPDLVRKKVVQPIQGLAANLEILTSSTISLVYKFPESDKHGIDIYYRGSGSSADEFLYLIDWLMHCQQMQQGASVRVKTLQPDKTSAAIFANAKQTYAESFAGTETSDLSKRLDRIKYSSMTYITPTFSDIEIGMDDA